MRRISWLNSAAMLLLCPAVAGTQPPAQWRASRTHEQLLPDSLNCWEPALASGPRGQVFVVAGRRNALPNARDFDQRLVIWRSDTGGASFKAPRPLTVEGRTHYDQRVAVDAKGTVYVSYMDREKDASGRSVSRLRLARSRDGGDTFAVQTVTTHQVSDKPELAVSSDGSHIYIVYESGRGPIVIASHDGGATWGDPQIIMPGEGRHFWPEALAVAPDASVWLAVPSMSDSDITQGKQTPVRLHVFRSGDGGRSWQDSDFGASPRLPKGCAHDANCRVKVGRIGVAVDGRSQAYVTYTEGAVPRQPFGLFLKSTTDAGRSWSAPQIVSAAPRPQSGDAADHDFAMVAAAGEGRVCVVWVDDRRGALDVWARCSSDAARTWGPDVLLSDRIDGAAYKSPVGFKAFYGHYGGVALDGSGRLHAAWGAGEPEYRTGGVWVNSLDISDVLRH